MMTAWKLARKSRAVLALSGLITVLAVHPAVSQAPPAAPAADPAPPPSAPPKLGPAELEKLLMPIALYPDALIATLLPACVYPLEIVQAARFMADTNNISKIDQQPWDESVKAIAKIPAALKKLNDDLQWTIQMGEVFLNQDKDVMDTIQSLRMKAQKAGTLRTTEQQVVIVTNMVVETKVEERVVVVTNTIVQIQPSNPQVVYVPTYPPTVYYPPPAYVYDPYAPLITFGVGVAVGAIIANNCDWHGGGCYWGGGDVDIDRNTSINVDRSRGDTTINRGGNRVSNRPAGGQKWQPDQNRVRSSGSQASAKTMESRGWGSGAGGGARPSTQPGGGARPGGPTASTRPSGGPSAGARPSTPSAGTRPSTPSAATRPSAGGGGYPGGANRPSASPTPTPSRPSGASPSAGSLDRSPGTRSYASPSPSRSSSSAFSGGSGGMSAGQRGAASRGGGGGGGRGGGGRGGGGRR